MPPEDRDVPDDTAPVRAARVLSRAVDQLEFGRKAAYVYNPLDYAWDLHEAYLRKYGGGRNKRALWVGMNPGPWGMVQTGVPFGDVTVVTEWMKLDGEVGRPPNLHAKRPVEGLACTRNERSGTRLWTFAKEGWGGLRSFFKEHLVVNYCPLAFFDEDGKNLTPNRLLKAERTQLFEPCDHHLRAVVRHHWPDVVIGVGAFATRRAQAALDREVEEDRVGPLAVPVARILHPSPANPKANQGWAEQVVPVLEEHGVGPPG